jgi:hypothetical protein
MNQQDKNLQIGQVIYILSNVKQKIEIDGNQVSWKVSVGPPGKERIVDSNRLDGEIYSSLEETKEVLHKRLLSFLNGLVAEAEKRAESWYGHMISKNTTDLDSAGDISKKNNDKIAPENLLSEFESNTENAENKVIQQPISVRSRVRSGEKEKIRNALHKMLAPEASEENAVNSDVVNSDSTLKSGVIDSEVVELPDGSKVKVNIRG